MGYESISQAPLTDCSIGIKHHVPTWIGLPTPIIVNMLQRKASFRTRISASQAPKLLGSRNAKSVSSGGNRLSSTIISLSMTPKYKLIVMRSICDTIAAFAGFSSRLLGSFHWRSSGSSELTFICLAMMVLVVDTASLHMLSLLKLRSSPVDKNFDLIWKDEPSPRMNE